MEQQSGAKEFRPGLRFSVMDGCIVVATILSLYFTRHLEWYVGFIIYFTVGHFFLFCNVFRISRIPELIWSGIFLAATIGTIIFSIPGWPLTIAISLVTTIILIAREVKKPSYHGIMWRRFNPNLHDWWEKEVLKD